MCILMEFKKHHKWFLKYEVFAFLFFLPLFTYLGTGIKKYKKVFGLLYFLHRKLWEKGTSQLKITFGNYEPIHLENVNPAK